jgi:hypothetical protein
MEDFESRLLGFLDEYNRHHAHPYQWTYSGTPLVRGIPFSQTRRQQRQGRAWFSPRPQRFERALSPETLQTSGRENWLRTSETDI